jgi:hypothetical protein
LVVALALLAMVCGGCAFPNEYSGTGVLETSGALARVARHTVTIASCPQLQQPVALMAFGEACILRGRIVPGGFMAEPAVCTLDFDDGARSLRVSSASAWVPLFYLSIPPSYGSDPDSRRGNHMLTPVPYGVTLIGDDVATGRPFVYRLTVTRIAANDERTQRLCHDAGEAEASSASSGPEPTHRPTPMEKTDVSW